MRIICPTCASHYEVEIDEIGAEGQLVRCAQCREVWLVRQPAADAPEPKRAADPQPPGRPERDPNAFAAAFDAHARAAAQPIDFHDARRRLRRRSAAEAGTRSRGTGSIALLALSALAVAALAGLAQFRTAIVTHVPGSAAVYAALWLPANTAGLALRDVRSVVKAEGNKTVLSLDGEIANLQDGPTAVPNLTVVVRDDAQTPLYTWTTAAPKAKLAKGETIAFHSRLAAPPTDGHDVRVSFADAGTTIGPVRP